MDNQEFQKLVNQFKAMEQRLLNGESVPFDESSITSINTLIAYTNDLALVLEIEDEYDMDRIGEPWEDWEVVLLQKRHSSGVRFHGFSKALGRSVNEVRRKYIELGLLQTNN